MFDLPEAKRVRREELDNDDNNPEDSTGNSLSDKDASATLRARLASLYDDVIEESPLEHSSKAQVADDTNLAAPEDRMDTDDGPSYSFRLFSSDAKPQVHVQFSRATTAQRIVISSPSPPPVVTADSGRILSARHLSHYHTSASPTWSTRQETEFQDSCVAVSGAWIHDQSQRRNPGLEMRWRVQTLKLPRTQNEMLDKAVIARSTDSGDSASQRKKTKPNKKRRILLRERQRKKDAARAEIAKVKEAREVEEQEKRTRRNREKKVKKKAREKAKKAEGVTGPSEAVE